MSWAFSSFPPTPPATFYNKSVKLLSNLFSLALLISVTACGFELDFKESQQAKITVPDGLGGLVEPILGSLVCSGTVTAELYKLQSGGTLGHTPELTVPVTSGLYYFARATLPASSSSKVEFVVLIKGCSEQLSRPVTKLELNQNINYVTTLMGLTAHSILVNPLDTIEQNDLEDYQALLSGTSVLNVYNNLVGSPTAISEFNHLFNDSPGKFLDSYPVTTVTSFPTTIDEGVLSPFSVSASHFHPSYDDAFEWVVNGVTQSTSSTWNYTPASNASGLYTVDLYVGADDGSNHVDRAKPYFLLTRTLRIMDTVP